MTTLGAMLFSSTLRIGLQVLVGGFVSLLGIAIYQEFTRPKNMPPYPGGKQPLPLLGHILDLPKEKSWMTFRKWHQMYGPILTIWNGNTPTILVGDASIALELLEQRSSKYSSRPRSVVAGDLMTECKTILFATYGERWRRYRKAIHLGTSQKVVDTYLPIFENEGKVLAQELLDNPDNWYQSIFRYTVSSVVAITYGRRIVDIDRDTAYQKLSEIVGFQVKMNVPGAQWHETFPILQYLPTWANETKRKALEFREMNRVNFASLINEVQTKMTTDSVPKCYAKMMLENRTSFGDLDNIEFNQQPGSLFAAGVDTTSSTLQSFVLALVLHPEVQDKLHREVDEVVGQDRTPTWSDENKLPYLKAVFKETLRWRPVAVLGGTPHANTEDDVFVYKGKSYFIPKGTTILASLWAINMNEETYPNPDSFDPDRFYNGQEYPSPGNKGHSSFGWGRRVCPGAYFAERSLYITMARLAWGFKFEMKRGESGKTVKPDASMETGYTSGFNCRPHPFPCVITPRSGTIESVIRRECDEALNFLHVYENYND